MNIIPALLLIRMISADAAISPTSTNSTELTTPTSADQHMRKEKLPAPKSADSYESPTTESGDLSAMGETSTRSHETQPVPHKKTNKVAKKTMKENCDTLSDQSLCEKTNQMNRSMREKTDHATATQRGGGAAGKANTELE